MLILKLTIWLNHQKARPKTLLLLPLSLKSMTGLASVVFFAVTNSAKRLKLASFPTNLALASVPLISLATLQAALYLTRADSGWMASYLSQIRVRALKIVLISQTQRLQTQEVRTWLLQLINLVWSASSITRNKIWLWSSPIRTYQHIFSQYNILIAHY